MGRIAILLKSGIAIFIFFQLRNERTQNIVTVPLGVESLRKKMSPTMRLSDIPTQTPIFSPCSGERVGNCYLYQHTIIKFVLNIFTKLIELS
jgi:hypothetical protein